MAYAAVIEVNNSGEDPDEGRRGLREELLPVLEAMPGFVSAHLLTAYDKGRGLAVVVFSDVAAAEQLATNVTVGQSLRDGVTVLSSDVFEVAASAHAS
ncbi:MAG TPA: hypothetical protein VFV00_16275 [Acidimicrobiales bacterium]|nr:hypothetical protein [Acidimicrobiales bacterium]